MAFNGETDIGERIGGLMDKIVSKNGISSGFVMNMPEHNKYIVRLGGDVGADLIFGLSCIDFKIPLTMKLPDPFYYKRSVKPHPDKRWIERFHTVRDYADEIQYSGDTNDWRNNFKRNVDMISPADLVYVAYRYDDLDQYTGTTRPRTGGTSHGIMTAKKFERKIIHLKVT